MMAFPPVWPGIVRAHSCLMERLNLCARVSVSERHFGIEAIHRPLVVDAELRQSGRAVGSKLSEIIIKRAVLLRHKEDVLDNSCLGCTYRHGG
jgi:hypothetical protein